MTMDEIRASDKDVLTVRDIAPVLGAHPQWIRTTAKETPERVGFPFAFSGNRMKIPREGFIRWMEGTNAK